MTTEQYAELGYKFPPAEIAFSGFGSGPWVVTVTTDFGTGQFVIEQAQLPTTGDVLYTLLEGRARWATLFLRDFVRDWPDQSAHGRSQAIGTWKRLRRERRELKRLFGEACP